MELVVGAAISVVISWFFAKRSSLELAKTHQQVVLLLRALEASGSVVFTRNADGEPVGVVISLDGNAGGTSHASAELSSTPS